MCRHPYKDPEAEAEAQIHIQRDEDHTDIPSTLTEPSPITPSASEARSLPESAESGTGRLSLSLTGEYLYKRGWGWVRSYTWERLEERVQGMKKDGIISTWAKSTRK